MYKYKKEKDAHRDGRLFIEFQNSLFGFHCDIISSFCYFGKRCNKLNL